MKNTLHRCSSRVSSIIRSFASPLSSIGHLSLSLKNLLSHLRSSGLDLKKTLQLVELVDDNQDVEELMNLPPEKILLRWMNFHLKKTEYKKTVTNFSSDVKDGEAYAYLLNILALVHSNPSTFVVRDHFKRATLVLEHADKMGCKRYLTAKDIVECSPNLNLAFVAHIFQHRKPQQRYLEWINCQ